MPENKTTTISLFFGGLSDPRTGKNIRHPLINIITIALCGVICGANTWVEIEAFGYAKQAFLSGFLDLTRGIPSHDTFGRFFRWPDARAFGECFELWVQSICERIQGEIVAIDGKCLCGSKDGRHAKGGIYLVNAWAKQNGLILAQEKVDEKSNEITAIPYLLNLLDIQDCVVTTDAMGCQIDIASLITQQGADYVLAVKGNQGTLHKDIQFTFDDPCLHEKADYCRQYDDSHGRAVVRECWVITDPEVLAHLNPGNRWAKASSLIKVFSRTGYGNDLTTDTRYFISSLNMNAQCLLDIVRSHWHVENSLHWVLDIAFREDDSRVRCDHAPHNLALLRHIALNLLKRESSFKVGIHAKRLRAGWDNDYLLKVLCSGL